MRIIVRLPDDEAYRDIEAQDGTEDIRASYRQIVREIENICCKYQIRYTDIEVLFSED